jgi:hypothetical protein
MRRILAIFALALATVLVHPPAAGAQCNERCIKLVAPEGGGTVGYGCVVDNDSGAACIARSTVCYTKLCWNAMLTDPSGRMLAVADICGDNVTVRSLARTSRQEGRKKPPQRDGRVVVAASRTGDADSFRVTGEPGRG